jgi:hypothetical protein
MKYELINFWWWICRLVCRKPFICLVFLWCGWRSWSIIILSAKGFWIFNLSSSYTLYTCCIIMFHPQYLGRYADNVDDSADKVWPGKLSSHPALQLLLAWRELVVVLSSVKVSISLRWCSVQLETLLTNRMNVSAFIGRVICQTVINWSMISWLADQSTSCWLDKPVLFMRTLLECC